MGIVLTGSFIAHSLIVWQLSRRVNVYHAQHDDIIGCATISADTDTDLDVPHQWQPAAGHAGETALVLGKQFAHRSTIALFHLWSKYKQDWKGPLHAPPYYSAILRVTQVLYLPCYNNSHANWEGGGGGGVMHKAPLPWLRPRFK